MRAIRLRASVAIGLALLAMPSFDAFALVRPQRSFMTTIELKSCRSISNPSEGRAWLCKGLDGYPVYYAEGEGRMFLSLGFKPMNRKAASQSLKAFNTLFEGRHARAPIEWRVYFKDNRPQPYAAIVRTFTTRAKQKGEVIVVLRVTPDETCMVAKIDALATPGAIALARQIADGAARKFDCRNDPTIEGATGRSPM